MYILKERYLLDTNTKSLHFNLLNWLSNAEYNALPKEYKQYYFKS